MFEFGGIMASVNKVILIGNLGKDPEFKFTPGGQAVATFSIATTERYADKSGQRQEKTEWHNIVVWGKLAELANQYLKKGRSVYIEGRITTRSWDDKDGNKRYKTEIVGNSIQFLGGSGSGAGGAEYDYSQGGAPSFDANHGSAHSAPSFDSHPVNNGPADSMVEEDLPF
jgi:single-strand DNA-binding protein